MTVLRCLACGSRIAQHALTNLVEQNAPTVSQEELEIELDKDRPQIQCYSCDWPYNRLVPEEDWTKEREAVKAQAVEQQIAAAKAADQNANTAPTEEAKKAFRKRAKEYRDLARVNKQALEAGETAK